MASKVLVLIVGSLALGPSALGGNAAAVLFTCLTWALLGLALARWAVPARPVDILFLRSFGRDRQRHDVRRMIEMTLHPLRLGGIKDPRRRIPYELRPTAALLSIALHVSNRYLALEADQDWRIRLVNSLAQCRGVILDLREATESLREELELALLQLEASRVLLMVSAGHEPPWAAVGRASTVQRVVMPDTSADTLALLSRRIEAFATALAPPTHRREPAALARARALTPETEAALVQLVHRRTVREVLGLSLLAVTPLAASTGALTALSDGLGHQVTAYYQALLASFIGFAAWVGLAEGAARHRLRWRLRHRRRLQLTSAEILAPGLILVSMALVVYIARGVVAHRPEHDFDLLVHIVNAVIREDALVDRSRGDEFASQAFMSRLNIPWSTAACCPALVGSAPLTVLVEGPAVRVTEVDRRGPWMDAHYEVVVAPLGAGSPRRYSCMASTNLPATVVKKMNCLPVAWENRGAPPRPGASR